MRKWDEHIKTYKVAADKATGKAPVIAGDGG